jgi:hypothetical protein
MANTLKKINDSKNLNIKEKTKHILDMIERGELTAREGSKRLAALQKESVSINKNETETLKSKKVKKEESKKEDIKEESTADEFLEPAMSNIDEI